MDLFKIGANFKVYCWKPEDPLLGSTSTGDADSLYVGTTVCVKTCVEQNDLNEKYLLRGGYEASSRRLVSELFIEPLIIRTTG